MKIFDRLKLLRLSRKLTQRDVARGAGLTETGYQYYEYGDRIPQLKQLVALADFFGVSLDYLVGRTDNPDVNR